MQRINNKTFRQIVLISTLFVFGPVFLLTTNPARLPLVFVIVPFLWLFVALFVGAWLLTGQTKLSRTRRARTIVSGVLAILPVMLLVMTSIHQIMLRDILLVVGIIFLAIFYMSRADFIR